MAVARGFVPKTDLTPEEKLAAAYSHLLCGVAQHDIAALYRVNSGRVAEAVSDVRIALQWDEQEN